MRLISQYLDSNSTVYNFLRSRKKLPNIAVVLLGQPLGGGFVVLMFSVYCLEGN